MSIWILSMMHKNVKHCVWIKVQSNSVLLESKTHLHPPLPDNSGPRVLKIWTS